MPCPEAGPTDALSRGVPDWCTLYAPYLPQRARRMARTRPRARAAPPRPADAGRWAASLCPQLQSEGFSAEFTEHFCRREPARPLPARPGAPTSEARRAAAGRAGGLSAGALTM